MSVVNNCHNNNNSDAKCNKKLKLTLMMFANDRDRRDVE